VLRQLLREVLGEEEGRLAELASRLKRAVDVLQPLRALEETVGLRLRAERLEAFPVDVFRRGRGVRRPPEQDHLHLGAVVHPYELLDPPASSPVPGDPRARRQARVDAQLLGHAAVDDDLRSPAG